MKVKEQVEKLLQALNTGLHEKESAMALAFLSAVAGESIFLLGAPGVAKSLIARRLKFAFQDGKAFEYLMNRFSTPDEIFGPVAISKLKEDKYERIVADYLPDATIVFLDEIWKAGPSIQNALLTVLNEKVYRNGAQEIKLPMKAILSASNELPAKEEGLEALWDRFLLRLKVEGIKDKKAFDQMIAGTADVYGDTVAKELKITEGQYEAWGKGIDKIEVPAHVFQVIQMIRSYVQEHNKNLGQETPALYVSDRRWRKVIRLLRTASFLNGRSAVDLMDCFLVMHCIWDEERQISVVERFVKEAVEKHGYKPSVNMLELEEMIKAFRKDVDVQTNIPKWVENLEPKVSRIQNEDYYSIKSLVGHLNYDQNRFIPCSVLEKANPQSFSSFHRHREDLGDKDPIQLKLSSNPNKVFIIDQSGKSLEVELDTVISKKEVIVSFVPHQAILEQWDRTSRTTQTNLANLNSQVEEFRAAHLSEMLTNIFVDPGMAAIVESNFLLFRQRLEALSLEINSIQAKYQPKTDTQTTKGLLGTKEPTSKKKTSNN